MDPTAITDQIDRILRSQSFANKSQFRKLLEVLFKNMDSQTTLKPDRVIQELWPHEVRTKGSADVATEMNRLGHALESYYNGEGKADPIIVILPNRSVPRPDGTPEKRWIVAKPREAETGESRVANQGHRSITEASLWRVLTLAGRNSRNWHCGFFFGTTTGTYEVSATMTSGSNPENLCISLYQPGGTAVVSLACTETNVEFTVQAKFTPSVNGTFVIIVYGSDNNYSLNYNVSVQCVGGLCKPPPPSCILKDAPAYNAATQTLTMNFTIGTPVAVTWNAWLTSQNTIQSLWSQSLPITEPQVTVTETQANVPKSGKVGILSTFTTPTAGITCSSWTQVNTGKP